MSKGAAMGNAREMIRHLTSESPDIDHGQEMMLFGQLVGSWDLDMTAIDPDGGTHAFTAEWHFGWTLEGRAVQDVLITRSLEGDVVGFGSTVRSFDPKRGQWWVVWQDPLAGEFAVLLARPEGDRIVLEGQWTIGESFRPFRWTFSDITPDSFHWEDHVLDNGGTWRLIEEIQARRQPES
jgi:hypothetical protein